MTDQINNDYKQKLSHLSLDKLNELEDKIVTITTLLRQNFIDGEVSSILADTERNELIKTSETLHQLQSSVSAAKVEKQRIHPGKDEEKLKALAEADEIAKTTFPVKGNDIMSLATVTIALSACISELYQTTAHNELLSRIHYTVSDETNIDSLKHFLQEQYNENIELLAQSFLAINGTFVNNRYVVDWTLRVRKRLDNPSEQDRNALSALQEYIS